MSSQSTTYIGIAFNTANGFPMQWSIVLSDNEQFNGTMACGTLFDTVNGWVESWRTCTGNLTVLAPYLSVLGIIKVGKVDCPVRDMKYFIYNKVWKTQASPSGNGPRYPPTDEYVRDSLLYLCGQRIISLPPSVTGNFVNHIAALLPRLQGGHHIISIV